MNSTARNHSFPHLSPSSGELHAIPMRVPSGCHRGSLDETVRSVSGSYIGSVMSARSGGFHRPSLALHAAPSPLTEKKLNRTRKMSEAIQSPTEVVGGKAPKLRIPAEVGDITKDFVKMVVNQYLMKKDRDLLNKGTDDILDFIVKDCKGSTGDFSSTYVIDVTIAIDDVPTGKESLSFVAKLLPYDDTGRVYVFENNLLEKEIEVYFEVLPSLRQFLRAQKSGDKSAMVDDCIPDCVYGSHNLDGAGALVFRSCTDKGFRHCEDPVGLSASELSVVVKNIAQLHASGRALIAKNGSEAMTKRYPYLTKDMYSNGMLMAEVREQLETYAELLTHIPEEESREIQQVFKKLKRGGPFKMLRGLKHQGPETLNTIIHGELWEKNILFRTTDATCKMLDWKNAKMASGMLDLGFLIFSSCNAKVIEENWEQVLNDYHRTFCATLDLLEPKCAKPSRQEVHQDFQQTKPVALLHAICMFVKEMEHLERMTVNLSKENEEQTRDIAQKLKLYEKRAMNLLKAVDYDRLLDDFDYSEEDEDEANEKTKFCLSDDEDSI